MTVQAHALDVLEFARLLDYVAGHASTTPGAARIRSLRPTRVGGTHLDRADALHELHGEHTRVVAMRASVLESASRQCDASRGPAEFEPRVTVEAVVQAGIEPRRAAFVRQRGEHAALGRKFVTEHLLERARLAGVR